MKGLCPCKGWCRHIPDALIEFGPPIIISIIFIIAIFMV